MACDELPVVKTVQVFQKHLYVGSQKDCRMMVDRMFQLLLDLFKAVKKLRAFIFRQVQSFHLRIVEKVKISYFFA